MEKANERRRVARCRQGVRGEWWAGRCKARPNCADGRERAVGDVSWHVVPRCCQGGGGGPIGKADEAVGSGGGGGLGVVRRCVDGGGGGVLSSWGVTQC